MLQKTKEMYLHSLTATKLVDLPYIKHQLLLGLSL